MIEERLQVCMSSIPVRVLICRSNSIAPGPRVGKESRTLSWGGYAVSALGWDRIAGAHPARLEVIYRYWVKNRCHEEQHRNDY